MAGALAPRDGTMWHATARQLVTWFVSQLVSRSACVLISRLAGELVRERVC